MYKILFVICENSKYLILSFKANLDDVLANLEKDKEQHSKDLEEKLELENKVKTLEVFYIQNVTKFLCLFSLYMRIQFMQYCSETWTTWKKRSQNSMKKLNIWKRHKMM